jgi:hypothetical protein
MLYISTKANMFAHSLSQRNKPWRSMAFFFVEAAKFVEPLSRVQHSLRHRYLWKELIFSAGLTAVSPEVGMLGMPSVTPTTRFCQHFCSKHPRGSHTSCILCLVSTFLTNICICHRFHCNVCKQTASFGELATD